MQIETKDGKQYAKIAELHEWEKNPRSITAEGMDRLTYQIKRLGQHSPLIVKEDGTVMSGNMRLKAMRTLGIEDVWVWVIPKDKENMAEEYALSANDRAGYYEDDLLAKLMPELDIDWSKYSVDLREPMNLKDFLEESKAVVEDEPPEKEEGPADSQEGEVYQVGKHRIMCGNSTKIEDMEKLMNGQKAKVVFTSPPYNMGADMYKKYTDDLKSEEYIKFNLQVINNLVPFLKGYLFWNISYNKKSRWEFIEIMYKIVKETGLQFLEMIVWDKGHGMPITASGQLTRQYEDVLMVADADTIKEELELYFLGTTEKGAYFNKRVNKGITNYWRIDTNNTQTEMNKACFPVKLPAKGIQLTSEIEEIVLDPFLGSGSTMMACEQLNRVCYGIELDPSLCDVVRKRYAKFIGKEDEWKTITPKI
jgi:DNA modification methylase